MYKAEEQRATQILLLAAHVLRMHVQSTIAARLFGVPFRGSARTRGSVGYSRKTDDTPLKDTDTLAGLPSPPSLTSVPPPLRPSPPAAPLLGSLPPPLPANVVCLRDSHTTERRILIVLEFCGGGDLGQFIQARGPSPEPTARHFMLQLAAGLTFLRSKQLIHRDIKPQNLLLSDNSSRALLKVCT